jgi:hypothetical protein
VPKELQYFAGMFAYQLSVKPCGGNTTTDNLENELTTTGTKGDRRNTIIPMVKRIKMMWLVPLRVT